VTTLIGKNGQIVINIEGDFWKRSIMAQYFKDFFKTRAVGFWLFLLSAVLASAGSGVYYYFYHDDSMLRYFSQQAFLLPLIASAGTILLSLIRPLSKWAPLVLFSAEFYAFCQFINGTYLYLSSVFFGGITAEALSSLNMGFIVSVAVFLAVILLSLVATFLKNGKERKSNTEQKTVACEVEA
jgi:hypothetical protein